MIYGVTIDGASTRDMDDGLFAECIGDDVRLCVAITNVAKNVKVGGEVDDAARAKCITTYRHTGGVVRSMLPPQFTDEVCSLSTNQPRSVVVVELLIGPSGNIRRASIRVDEFVNRVQLSYNDIPAVICGARVLPANMASAVIALQIGTTRLFAARKDRGSVAYADAAAGVLSSEDGILERVTESEFVGCMMVQEAMIAANEAISRYAAKNDIPIIYRNHTASIATPPKADVVAQLEQAKNLPLPHLSALIERVDVLLNRARYEAHVRGHFALCAPFYTHATSPIRRYADLVTQRQIVAHLQKERMPYTQRELVAMAAHINVTIDDAVNEQREELKARTISITESRLARDGYQGLNELEFERVVHQLRSNSSMPSVEFVDDVVRRLESGNVTHRAIASLLPMLQSSALWEHVSSAICAKFAVEPERATLALKAAKGLGLWSANVVDIMATKAPHPPMNSCVGTLMDGDQVFRGPKCFAAAQRTAWHRAVAAVVIQQLDGEVPKDWLSVAITGALAPLATSHKHAVSELAELAIRISKSPPLFVFAAEGPAHRPTFKCTCTVGGMKTSGSGRDKQTAKNMAASAMITKLSGGVKKEARA